MSDNGYPSDWDAFIEEAEKDDRVGEVEAVVTDVRTESWPSGDPRYKVLFVLPNSGNAKVDATFSDPPNSEQLAAVKASGDRKRIRGTAMGLTLHKTLREHYGITKPTDIKVGAAMRLKTVKNKEGFIRTVAFLPKSGGGDGPASGVGF